LAAVQAGARPRVVARLRVAVQPPRVLRVLRVLQDVAASVPSPAVAAQPVDAAEKSDAVVSPWSLAERPSPARMAVLPEQQAQRTAAARQEPSAVPSVAREPPEVAPSAVAERWAELPSGGAALLTVRPSAAA
jgi:hypothetical protein